MDDGPDQRFQGSMANASVYISTVLAKVVKYSLIRGNSLVFRGVTAEFPYTFCSLDWSSTR